MQPLNPFLRAFFASKLPPQCYPSEHYVLLAPTTELLLSSKDQETQTSYADFVSNEDFLASHVLRVTQSPFSAGNNKDALGLRDSKSKARQYTTLDGRVIVIKDVSVYTNKGFKTLAQAQLLQDEVYYTHSLDASQWLIYYISRPLLGTPISLAAQSDTANTSPSTRNENGTIQSSSDSTKSKQVTIKIFSELLNQYPMIARQFQPGLEKLIQHFKRELEKPLPDIPSLSASSTLVDGRESLLTTASSTNSHASSATFVTYASPRSESEHLTPDQDVLRSAVETLVTSAIDLFHNVDKQQLSNLAIGTNLSGPTLERMIERYVFQQVHEKLLFPRLCAANADDEERLDKCKEQMSCIDIAQVGLTEDEGLPAKRQLARRVAAGVEAFKKMGVTGSPEEMIQVLLETEKRVTISTSEDMGAFGNGALSSVKPTTFTTNADTLVSLLLIVIIRSPVRYLHARLAYMRDFSFADDVDSGEVGYALSTYEAVLVYIANNSRGLRKLSRLNRAVWSAVKKGDLRNLKSCLGLGDVTVDSGDSPDDRFISRAEQDSCDDQMKFTENNGFAEHQPVEHFSDESEAPLSHIYPWKSSIFNSGIQKSKVKKRVSMDTRSLSSSSIRSGLSRISTNESFRSVKSAVSGEATPEQLAQIEDAGGNSILMLAIENNQPLVLEYLLSINELYPTSMVLHDHNNDGTTLLNASVQGSNRRMMKIMIDYVLNRSTNFQAAIDYLSIQDSKGRSAAHYLFNTPYLVQRMGSLIPWTLKDKNGQTPLFAAFRSYDNQAYTKIVETAMAAATSSKPFKAKLCLADHVDSKGNTLLHIVHDLKTFRQLLNECDSDPNAINDRRFTPLMVASKFARVDLVRTLFGDERVDLQARDLRGLTAVELAKDDDVRNRIDDMLLLSAMTTTEDSRTLIVRSCFVEDGSLRLIIKSGARNGNATITVSTSRRSLVDFENLSKWLALEHPASWMPSILRWRSPFQIPSKPSRHMLRDIQLRLDHFLATLLQHPTFSTHEMLWEFILVPDIDTGMLADRARKKAQARVEKLQEEYEPLLEPGAIAGVELFVAHARDQVVSVHQAYRSVLRRIAEMRNAASDLGEAHRLVAPLLAQLPFIEETHHKAVTRYVAVLGQTEYSPTTKFYYNVQSTISTSSALLHALARPGTLVRSIEGAKDALTKHETSASRMQNYLPSPFGLLDESRQARERESRDKAESLSREISRLGAELRSTQQTVATELAGWQETHAKVCRKALREWARGMVVVEKERLEGMRRAVSALGIGLAESGKAGLNGV